MAALIGARGKGANDGVLGIAPKSTILPVRVTLSGMMANPGYLDDGIDWAVAHGAKVISISFSTSEEPDVKSAIEKAQAADVVVVAGVGNLPGDTKVAYPARLPGVLAVGGVDRQGNHADVSVSGPEVMICAPAVDILSIGLSNRYLTSDGTSDATAIVAGAVALVRAKYPQLKGPEVIRRLTYTAQDKGAPGRDSEYGYGVLDLVKALTADVPPAAASAPASSAPPGNGKGGNWAAVIAAIGVAVVVMVGIFVLQAIIRGRRRTG
jgi:subtilisin family serine protease